MRSFFFFTMRRTPRSTLFPYTTLFRSKLNLGDEVGFTALMFVLNGGSNFSDDALNLVLANYEEKLEVERSEEHTSELQSHSDLVCRLLLEKKKESRRNGAETTQRHTHA